MKENWSQLRLACSLLALEDNLCKDLGPPGEEILAKDILGGQE